jgi:hypothetical protein
VAGAALSADSAAAAAAAASAAAAGFSSIKTLAVPPLRARASDIAPMALQAALPEAVLRGYTAVELTDAAELQLAGKRQGVPTQLHIMHSIRGQAVVGMVSHTPRYAAGCCLPKRLDMTWLGGCANGAAGGPARSCAERLHSG